MCGTTRGARYDEPEDWQTQPFPDRSSICYSKLNNEKKEMSCRVTIADEEKTRQGNFTKQK